MCMGVQLVIKTEMMRMKHLTTYSYHEEYHEGNHLEHTHTQEPENFHQDNSQRAQAHFHV